MIILRHLCSKFELHSIDLCKNPDLSMAAVELNLYCYYSNGVAVEGADHHTVVQLIKKSGNTVRLSILSVTDEERAKLEVESTPTPSSVEYYERRSVPLAIPSSEKKTDENGKEYVVSVK